MPLRIAILSGLLCALSCAACGVSRPNWEFDRQLLAVDRLADHGDHQAALEGYEALLSRSYRDDMTRYIGLRIGLMLEHLGDCDGALRAWARVYQRPDSRYDENAARAAYRSALIYETCWSDSARSVDTLRGVALAWPSTVAGLDAFHLVVEADMEAGGAARALSWISAVYPSLRDTDLAARALFVAATLLREDVQDYEGAEELYTLLASRMTRSGLVDDAVWGLVETYQATGNIEAERALLHRFLRTREVTWFMANYDSAFYQRAYIRLADVHGIQGRVNEEIATLVKFTETFPLSLRLPEVYLRLADLEAEAGNRSEVERWLRALEEEHSHTRWARWARERHGEPGRTR